MENDIGKFIKSRLKELKKTQGWLAEKVDVSNVAVTKWIKSGQISRENVMAVANALHVPADMLLGGKDITIQNEFERQLILFFRGMSLDHKDDLLSIANNLYNLDVPNNKLSNPLPLPPVKRETQ